MILALAIAGLFFLPDPWRFVVVFCALLFEVGEVFLWIRFLRRYRVTTGAEGMIGQRGEVIGPDRVRVRGEIWRARGAGGTGESVRVAGVEGLTLVVEPEGPA
ncbi:MAG: NfeD-like C-terminal, partner-binding [Solirubrobacterales bacterium]|nr:NfeD-like C-terminal, partner-binding [Solirubrobacterales bacterium]